MEQAQPTLFRTITNDGVVRAYALLSLDPIEFGIAHGNTFVPVTEVSGRYHKFGIGTGFKVSHDGTRPPRATSSF